MFGLKTLLCTLFFVFYLYSIRTWFITNSSEEEKPLNSTNNDSVPEFTKPNNTESNVVKVKKVVVSLKDVCSALEIFIQKPDTNKIRRSKFQHPYIVNNALEVLGITALLAILILSAVVDVLNVNDKERVAREFYLEGDGERRESLAEFADKKMLRRESSKFSLQLQQITESVTNVSDEHSSTREIRPYMRAESINSYLGEKIKCSAPASFGGSPITYKMVPLPSDVKLFGARPSPMVRRSSFPALPLNPKIHALMTNSRESSFDSDDETEKKHRRVRILRRF